MTEKKEKARGRAALKRGDGKKATSGTAKTDEDIIELSDIAVGTSPEDEAIIELTEDLVDSAIEGVSRATGRMDSGDVLLDLSPASGTGTEKQPADRPDISAEILDAGPADDDIMARDTVDSIEEDIARELDNYFQIEEQTQDLLDETIQKSEPASIAKAEFGLGDEVGEETVQVTVHQLESILERVVQRMYGEKIDRILNEVIERVVTDDIERLKEYLLKRS